MYYFKFYNQTDKLMREMNDMKKVSEKIMDEIYDECFIEFENYQNEFVEKIFE